MLAIDDIQGNVVPGFNKDHVQLLFLRIDDHVAAKKWIEQIAGYIASAHEVLDFNRLFKGTSKRRGFDDTVKSTWINIAFSYLGLKRLVPNEVVQFKDAAFHSGAGRSSANWIIGGPNGEPDVVLIIAADDEDDLAATIRSIEDGINASDGVHIIFGQCGDAQHGAMAGHEHFGWRDGVSQPGLRGRISDVPGDVLTPRQNPRDLDQGLPGQDLLWPGEFIFGYRGQDRNEDVVTARPNSLRPDRELVAPEWARDGSYLVFRRLRQDVGAFHRFLHDEGDRLGVEPEELGARLVGRWPSGAPLVRAPLRDNPKLAADEFTRNNFEYGPAPAGKADRVPRDPDGLSCPFSAHIRKAYPRDETVVPDDPNPYEGMRPRRTLGERDTQTHRLLRRGIPYGPSSNSTPQEPIADDVDRGLLFMAYMTSIIDQFEFVTKHWLNDPDFKKTSTGVDPILGQVRTNGPRHVRTVLPGQQASVEIKLRDWVIATGGGYFFAPSIPALKHLSDPAH